MTESHFKKRCWLNVETGFQKFEINLNKLKNLSSIVVFAIVYLIIFEDILVGNTAKSK